MTKSHHDQSACVGKWPQTLQPGYSAKHRHLSTIDLLYQYCVTLFSRGLNVTDVLLYAEVLHSSFSISRHHTPLPLSFFLLLGGLFSSTLSHAFIPFNLFSVTKQNLLIFSKAPNESLYAHSVPFSHSVGLSHTLQYTHRVLLFEQLCPVLCMFISAIVMVLLLSFLLPHSSVMSLRETMGEFSLLTLMVCCWWRL